MVDYTSYNEEQLVSGLAQGDEACFTEIYDRYWEQLYRLALAMSGEELLADDLVQDVFLSLWLKREEVEIKHLPAYLKQSIRYQVLWLIRKKKVSRECFNRIAKIATEAILDQPYLVKETASIFREVVQNLPPEEQEILRLSREEGLSCKEIAKHTGIPLRTVERKMSVSLKMLRTKLGELLNLLFFY